MCADLCGLQPNDLTGMGIEKIVHPSSLASVIEKVRQIALGEHLAGSRCRINLRNQVKNSQETHVWVYPLNEPARTFLVLGNSMI
jgi:hypothetical protein